MTQKMRCSTAGADDPRALEGTIDNMRDRVMSFERAKRRAGAYENRRGFGGWPAFLQIRSECLPELLSQRKSSMTAGFPRDLNPGVFPIDVGEAQLNDVAGAQP